MHYVFNNKDCYKKCRNYLISRGIEHDVYDVKKYYIINVFNNSLKEKIENEERAFLEMENLSLENGYLATKQYKDKTGKYPTEEIINNPAVRVTKAPTEELRCAVDRKSVV